ncbi:regulatory particle non-ATPase 12A [Pelomyxa schiedti]|nr:regulatory particle non-ATPase 12A [Pelomyxa schiedti]
MSTAIGSAFNTTVELFEEFKLLFAQYQFCTPNENHMNSLLTKMKAQVMMFSVMKTSLFPTPEPELVKELALSRDIFEHACLFCLKTKDILGFSRYFALLRPFYFDYRTKIDTSAREQLLLGLNLLHLLSQNKLAEFHTELECLPHEVLSSMYIKFPVELEQFMMEGSYNKVLQARTGVPSEWCNLFVDILSETVRNDIASCSEKSYKKLPVSVAKEFLYLPEETNFLRYVEEHHWFVEDGYVVFNKVDTTKVTEVPAMRQIRETLSYAKELERIV